VKVLVFSKIDIRLIQKIKEINSVDGEYIRKKGCVSIALGIHVYL